MVRKYAKELIEDGGYGNIPQEKIEAVLEEVVNHENLETKETAEEFFNSMWEKLSKVKVKFNRKVKP